MKETRRTYTVEEARKLGGVGRSAAYEEIRAKGTLFGVPVLKTGQKLIRVPRAAFDAVLDGQPPQAA
jgi:hypothetical protein